jgi:hypothetical protein
MLLPTPGMIRVAIKSSKGVITILDTQNYKCVTQGRGVDLNPEIDRSLILMMRRTEKEMDRAVTDTDHIINDANNDESYPDETNTMEQEEDYDTTAVARNRGESAPSATDDDEEDYERSDLLNQEKFTNDGDHQVNDEDHQVLDDIMEENEIATISDREQLRIQTAKDKQRGKNIKRRAARKEKKIQERSSRDVTGEEELRPEESKTDTYRKHQAADVENHKKDRETRYQLRNSRNGKNSVSMFAYEVDEVELLDELITEFGMIGSADGWDDEHKETDLIELCQLQTQYYYDYDEKCLVRITDEGRTTSDAVEQETKDCQEFGFKAVAGPRSWDQALKSPKWCGPALLEKSTLTEKAIVSISWETAQEFISQGCDVVNLFQCMRRR